MAKLNFKTLRKVYDAKKNKCISLSFVLYGLRICLKSVFKKSLRVSSKLSHFSLKRDFLVGKRMGGEASTHLFLTEQAPFSIANDFKLLFRHM